MAEAGIHNLVFSISYALSSALQPDVQQDSMGIEHLAGIPRLGPEH